MRLVSPLLQLDNVNASTVLLFIIRGRLCISLVATVAIMLFCHIMLLSAFVDRQIMANNQFYNRDDDNAGAGRVFYYEEGHHKNIKISAGREDIVDLQGGDHVDVMNRRDEDHEDIVDVGYVESNNAENNHGSKHLLAEYSYDKEQTEKDIPNQLKGPKNKQITNEKINDAIKPNYHHTVETFVINIPTLSRQKREKDTARDKEKSSTGYNQNILSINKKHNSQNIPASKNKVSESDLHYKPAIVQEVNIEQTKKDEEWEADEDMSLEHLIVADSKSTTTKLKKSSKELTTTKPSKVPNSIPTQKTIQRPVYENKNYVASIKSHLLQSSDSVKAPVSSLVKIPSNSFLSSKQNTKVSDTGVYRLKQEMLRQNLLSRKKRLAARKRHYRLIDKKDSIGTNDR